MHRYITCLTAVVMLSVVSPIFGGMDLSTYTPTWTQDFTAMTSLNVTAWGPGSTWIAHTPSSTDWVRFLDPSGPNMPFNLGNGHLTIRAQNKSGVVSGGLLSSVDSHGRGFSQRFGYFEVSAKLPSGSGAWPAFWLLDVDSMVNGTGFAGGHEIDIFEQYSRWPTSYHTTMHYWNKQSGGSNWGTEVVVSQCDITTGFHTYGVDIQRDNITFYLDRVAYWQFPNVIPGHNDMYNRSMYVLVNNAYGGADGQNEPPPVFQEDLLVQYVRVWQGHGGSANAFSTDNANTVTFSSGKLTLTPGQRVAISGMSLTFTTHGNLQVINSNGYVMWQTGTYAANCSSCLAVFQNDGNFVIYGVAQGWSSGTYNNNGATLTFSNTVPVLQIRNTNCNVIWTANITSIANPAYIGCFADASTRDLPNNVYSGSGNTIENCISLCSSAGYAFAGMQSARECWCGNSYGSHGQVAETSCSQACTGNSQEKCGAGWTNSVYRTPTKFIGCFVDSSTRDLPYLAYSGASNTQDSCISRCSGAGYLFAGMEAGYECWCGNSYGSHGQDANSACSTACTGNPSQTCGAGWRNSVYRV